MHTDTVFHVTLGSDDTWLGRDLDLTATLVSSAFRKHSPGAGVMGHKSIGSECQLFRTWSTDDPAIPFLHSTCTYYLRTHIVDPADPAATRYLGMDESREASAELDRQAQASQEVFSRHNVTAAERDVARSAIDAAPRQLFELMEFRVAELSTANTFAAEPAFVFQKAVMGDNMVSFSYDQFGRCEERIDDIVGGNPSIQPALFLILPVQGRVAATLKASAATRR